jgi:dihydroorotate dehydrogenase (fumarate)
MPAANGSLIEFTPAAIEDERLATSLAGFELQQPVTHAGGICDGLEQVPVLSRSVVSIVMVGSIYEVPPSIGDRGVTSRGLEYYGEHILEMVNIAHTAHKPLAVSVAGFNPDGYGNAAQRVGRYADIIEVNFGFPSRNWDENERRFTAPCDSRNIAPIVTDVKQRAPDTPLGVKLPHYTEPDTLDEVAEAIRGLPIYYVAAGGLAQVMRLRQLLPPSIQLVGVEKGPDLLDYLGAGASVVQVAASYWNGGKNPGVFSDILSKYVDQLPETPG